MVFDTAGFCGAMDRSRPRWSRNPATRIVFATDYPQEIRAREAVQDSCAASASERMKRILSGNVGLLLKT